LDWSETGSGVLASVMARNVHVGVAGQLEALDGLGVVERKR
jgi:hypothetical protein